MSHAMLHGRQTDRQTDRLREKKKRKRQRHSERDRQTDRQTDRETERGTETEKGSAHDFLAPPNIASVILHSIPLFPSITDLFFLLFPGANGEERRMLNCWKEANKRLVTGEPEAGLVPQPGHTTRNSIAPPLQLAELFAGDKHAGLWSTPEIG